MARAASLARSTAITIVLCVGLQWRTVSAFGVGSLPSFWSHRDSPQAARVPARLSSEYPPAWISSRAPTFLCLAATLRRVSPDLENVPIPFVDQVANSFIECYADSVATVDGIEYTIGVPCDYSVAICHMEADDEDEDADPQLVPVELDDPLMDDVFPVAESIVNEEFGEELVLQRTPQTLTLVGELEEDDEEFTEDDDIDADDEEDEEEVDVLLTFEHKGKEYSLVRLLDPILLVGVADPESPDNRILMEPTEADKIMPTLEELFLQFNEDPDTDLVQSP